MAFILIAVMAAFVFVRLGLWQLDRHAGARERNAAREAQLSEPPVPLGALIARAGPTLAADDLEWRRVHLAGRWDYAGEILIRNRMHNGRPGVHVVTPFRVETGAAEITVLVLRGWLPAPDAMSPGPVPGAETPDGRVASLVGVIRPSREDAGFPMLTAGQGQDSRPSFAAVDVAAIEAEAPDTVDYAPYFVQLLPDESDATSGPEGPVALALPEAGNGPHLAYAVQWFAFAAVTLIGTVAYVSSRRDTGGPSNSLRTTVS